MSATATATEKQQQKIKGGPFSIVVLNIIFSYAAESAHDAHFRLALTCENWKETVYFYGSGMWYNLLMLQFPKATMSTSSPARRPPIRCSRHSYMRRVATLGTNSNKQQQNLDTVDLFHEIANCTKDLDFACPILLENMARLEELDQSNGLPIHYCSVCEKKVFPVTNEKQLDRAGSEQRCVYVVQDASLFNGMMQAADFINEQEKAATTTKSDDDAAASSSSAKRPPGPQHPLAKHRPFHVCIITTEPHLNPLFDSGDERATPDNATTILRLIAAKLSESNRKLENKTPKITKKTQTSSSSPRYLSRDTLVAVVDDDLIDLHCTVVRIANTVNNSNGSSSDSSNNNDINNNHPALSHPMLKRDEMPTSLTGGWKFCVVADEAASKLFLKTKSYKKSILGALAASSKLITLESFEVVQHSSGKMQKRIDFLAQAVVDRVLDVAEDMKMINRPPPPPPPGMPAMPMPMPPPPPSSG